MCLFGLWVVGELTFVILLISCALAYCYPRLLLSRRFMKYTLISYYTVYTMVLVLLLATAFNSLAQFLLTALPWFNKSKFTTYDKHKLEHSDHPESSEANSLMLLFKFIFVGIIFLLLIVLCILGFFKVKNVIQVHRDLEKTQSLRMALKRSKKQNWS